MLGRVKHLPTWLRDEAKRKWIGFLVKRLADCHEAIRFANGAKHLNFLTLDKRLVPERIRGFEDLSYLFAPAHSNRGIIAQDFDEAAYLWQTVQNTRPRHILEIGRWLGGSTTLLASAAALVGGNVVSVDLKVKAPEFARDELIERHLHGLGLSNFRLCVGSSFDFDPGVEIDQAFIDGDHSYEGVKKDFQNVLRHLAPKGHLLFHDGAASRRFATYHEPVARLMHEIKDDPRFTFHREVGSIVHFSRI